jgi:hypothetical protein
MNHELFHQTEQILRLPFCSWEDRRSLPEFSGVYFLFIEDELLAYVGQSTKSIKARWVNHVLNERIKLIMQHSCEFGWYCPLFRIHYRVLADSLVQGIRDVEANSIRLFNPPWNKQLGANHGWSIGKIMRHYSTRQGVLRIGRAKA